MFAVVEDGSPYVWVALSLLSIPALIALNGLFVAAEYALVAVRKTRVEELVARGVKGARAVDAAVHNLSRSIAGTQLGVTLSSIGLGFVGEPALAALLDLPFQWLFAGWHVIAAHTVATILAFLLITFLHVVFGELIPKALALQKPDGTSLWLARPLIAFARITRPLLLLMNGASTLILRCLGCRPVTSEEAAHSIEELILLIDDTEEAGVLDADQADFVQNVFRLSDKRMRDCMVPREKMAALELNTPPQKILEAVRNGAHTRMPVYEGQIDNIVGIVNTKDLFYLFSLQGVVVLQDALYPALYLKPDEALDNTIRLFRKAKRPMALVRDDDDHIVGLITLEDVLEEIVGDIEDEHDRPTAKLRRRTKVMLNKSARPSRRPRRPSRPPSLRGPRLPPRGRDPRLPSASRRLIITSNHGRAPAAAPRFPVMPDPFLTELPPSEDATLPPTGPSLHVSPRNLPPQFGRYHVERKLGEGGMGAVYLAVDSQLARPVALKVPFLDGPDAEMVRARFLQEARSAAALHHPNICPIHDLGEIDGVPYLTMTYMEGEPLSRRVGPGRPLPPREAAGLVRRIALALEYAHENGVIHRDLKPGNVLIDGGGEPVVMDFGLARRNDAGAHLTQTGQVMGTPAYMPPEQLGGDVKAMGAACDVYSLGVVLFELLTGTPPFQGDLLSLSAQVLFDPPPRPSARRPGIDGRLDAICLRAGEEGGRPLAVHEGVCGGAGGVAGAAGAGHRRPAHAFPRPRDRADPDAEGPRHALRL